ncbi:hypothetical protein CEXT_583741 [Caerostris extrusa]|uniref:Uncharacterized protein n=1 Tax=Caerostris extrusa TaxID=172846 RepID=A0AAV4S9P4_CAEEX|nr:hypothetical protein CEXT_583741 [Caerostris extrusa]
MYSRFEHSSHCRHFFRNKRDGNYVCHMRRICSQPPCECPEVSGNSVAAALPEGTALRFLYAVVRPVDYHKG